MSDDAELLSFADEILAVEADALAALRRTLDGAFLTAVRMIAACEGSVVLTGMGKAGYVGQKISASFASTGTPSHFLHPAEAVHGDLGRLRRKDLVIALSFSGETDETTRLLGLLKRLGVKLIAVTGRADSTLARHADVTLCLGPLEEACPHNLAPSTSTTCMLALGDALFLTVARMRNFSPEEFGLYHPGGNLGRRLMRVEEAMTFRAGVNLPVAEDTLTVGAVLARVSVITRRPGAVLLVGPDGRLTGLFSDGDLRRLVETGRPDVLGVPIAEVMTRDPKRIRLGRLAVEAIPVLEAHRIDELPVVDADDRPAGMIDIQDLTSWRSERRPPTPEVAK
jgi:arabinose-5-phosphate isomerase